MFLEVPDYASVTAFSVCTMFLSFDTLIYEIFCLLKEMSEHVYVFKLK